MKKVKGVFEDNVVKLLEQVDAPDGVEVEVVFANEKTGDILSQGQRVILEKTKGIWADNPEIEKAFKIVQEGWKEWHLEGGGDSSFWTCGSARGGPSPCRPCQQE